MTRPVVAMDGRALAAHGLTPGDVSHAAVGTVVVVADGSAWRITAAGGLDPVVSFGFRSIASDPTARRRAA